MSGGIYLVNWLGGSSGAFVSALLHQLLTKPLSDDDISFSINGDSHKVNDMHLTNIGTIPGYNRESSVPVYKFQRPLIESQPFVMIDHEVPSHDELFEIFPNCKNVVVTVSDDMLPRLYGNMFFKNTCQGYPETKSFWEKQRQRHKCVEKFEDPNDAPINIAEQYIKEVSFMPVAKGAFYHSDYIPPEKYKDNITLIRFYDVIHNPYVVLGQLSKVANMPILSGHINFYQRYLEKQNELVNTKMPWLSDK